MSVYGVDTETPLSWLKVLATNEDVIEAETFEDILTFFSRHKYRGSTLFSFNLRFDSEAILKLLKDKDILQELYDNGAAPKGVWIEKYKCNIRWIPTKILHICKNSHCVTIYDIAQFYGGWGLEKASLKYLGEQKHPCDGAKIGDQRGYYEKYKEEIKRYCQQDAKLALRLAMLMKDTIEGVSMPKGKLSFTRPISQAKVSERYVLDHYKYPSILEQIRIYHDCAKLSYNGGLFATFKRGVFNCPLYSYDINSAYPDIMRTLPHWGNGRFVKSPSPDEYDTSHGWFFCGFDCQYIPYVDYGKPYEVEFCYGIPSADTCETVLLNPKRIVYPVGSRKRWITKYEYEWLLKNNFNPKWYGGFVWEEKYNGKEEYESPFTWVESIYNRRQEIKRNDPEDISQYALKIVLNGFYGKTAQAKHGYGKATNFFYASEITARTRLKVANIWLQYPDNVIEIATDSILLDRKIDLPLSSKIGDWGLSEYTNGILIGSGIRQTWHPDGDFVTHARGVTDKTNWDMLDEIKTGYNPVEKKANLDCDYLYFGKKRPVHVGEMLFHHKLLRFNDLGKFKLVSKKLNVNTDKKRRWERPYKDFKDFLGSEPQDSLPLRIDGDLIGPLYRKEREKAKKRIMRNESKRAKRIIQDTDIYEEDTTLRETEKEEDALREAKRYMSL